MTKDNAELRRQLQFDARQFVALLQTLGFDSQSQQITAETSPTCLHGAMALLM